MIGFPIVKLAGMGGYPAPTPADGFVPVWPLSDERGPNGIPLGSQPLLYAGVQPLFMHEISTVPGVFGGYAPSPSYRHLRQTAWLATPVS